MTPRAHVSALLGAVALWAALACGETSPPVPDAPPISPSLGEFPGNFTGPLRAVELPDERLLVHDPREQRFVLLDWSSGTETDAARIGDGPLEYRSGIRLVRAPGDSAWLFDNSRSRILVFSPEGKPLRAFPIPVGDGPAARLSQPWLREVGSDGSWFGQSRGFGYPPTLTIADSAAVVHVSADGARVDTLAQLATYRFDATLSPVRRLNAFDQRDTWAALSDGTVIVLRDSTYIPELYLPDGTRRVAEPIPYVPVRLTREAAERMLDSTARLTGQLVARMVEGAGISPTARMPALALPDPLPAQWPLFYEDPLFVDFSDRLWVRVRTAPFDTGSVRYDVIDRDGRFVRAVSLPPRAHIVTLGRRYVYVGRRDADDLLTIHRHALK